MPANLPPQYFEAEKNFRMAKGPQQKIAALEEMLAIMPKHKGTDHLRAELRGRIAKLTLSMEKKSGAHRATMTIEKEGAAQVVVLGLPNAGKSQLIGSVTNASPSVANYPFTTTTATPGMMAFENIKIQLIDIPPFVPQSIEFWMPNMLKKADALLFVIDLSGEPVKQMEAVIEQLDNMHIGIGLDGQEEKFIVNQQKSLVVANKLDLPGARQNYEALQTKYGKKLPILAISATVGTGLDEFKNETFQVLGITRIYTKTPGQKPDMEDPIILPRGSTLEDAAADVHKDFRAKLKYARIWGSGKHAGVRVKRDHILQDGDVVELHM